MFYLQNQKMSHKSNQNAITDFFRKTSETPSAKPTGSKRPAESSASTTSLREVSEVTESSKRARSSLSSATARKWLQESPELQEWLHFTEKDGSVEKFFCKACTKFESDIKNLRSFNDKYIKGSTNYRKSSPYEHAKSESHLVALQRLQVYNNKEPVRPSNQKDIPSLFLDMSEAQKSSLKKKFEIAYFVAKEELSFQKYERLLELEKFHDVPHEREYGNANQCANFIKLIAETVADDLCADVKKSHFLSVLWDGVTTVDTKECEGCFVQYLDVTGDGPEVELKTRFLGLEHVTRGNAVEILAALVNALEKLGVEDYKDRLVGLGADGKQWRRERGGWACQI